MAWVKLDDHFPEHRKLAELGDYAPLCGWLYVCGLAWCNRQLTDGRIPKAMVPRLATFRRLSIETASAGDMASVSEDLEADSLAGRLVDVGLWEDQGDAYLIHDYLDYQPSRRESGKLTHTRSQVGKQGARVRWQTDSKPDGKRHGKPNGKADGKLIANPMANGMAKTCPDPDPDPEEQIHVRRSAVADPPLPAPVDDGPGPRFKDFQTAWPTGRWEAAKQALEQFRRLSPTDRALAVESVAWRVQHDRRWQGPADDGRWAIPIPWRWLRDRRFEDVRHASSTPHQRTHAPERSGVWGEVFDALSLRLPRHDLHTWFGKATLARDDGDVLVVQVPDDVTAHWITRRLQADLAAAVTAVRPGAVAQVQVAEAA